MAIGDSLRTFLLADGTISGLLGTRVYPIQLPQKPTYPCAVYSTITGFSTHSQPGVSGLNRPRVQITACAETYAAAIALADAIKSRLDAYRGAMGSASVQGVFFQNEYERFDPEQKAYIVSRDYFIWAAP